MTDLLTQFEREFTVPDVSHVGNIFIYCEMEYFYIPTNVYHQYMVHIMHAIKGIPENNGYRTSNVFFGDSSQ